MKGLMKNREVDGKAGLMMLKGSKKLFLIEA